MQAATVTVTPLCVYIAGPMTGLPNNNRAAFDRVAHKLRSSGIACVNPAELDTPGEPEKTHDQYLRRDGAEMLRRCNAVVLLDGWTSSKGACMEVDLATVYGLPVFMAELFLRSVVECRYHDRHSVVAMLDRNLGVLEKTGQRAGELGQRVNALEHVLRELLVQGGHRRDVVDHVMEELVESNTPCSA